MASVDDMLDGLMEQCRKHEDPTGESGFLKQLFRTTLSQEDKSVVSEHLNKHPEEELR
jgi:hypothetical protein